MFAVAGDGSGVGLSSDNGQSWQTATFSPAAVGLSSIAQIDRLTYVVGGSNGAAWKSVNGGSTWSTINSGGGTYNSTTYNFIHMAKAVGSSRLFALAANPTDTATYLMRSDDRGATWEGVGFVTITNPFNRALYPQADGTALAIIGGDVYQFARDNTIRSRNMTGVTAGTVIGLVQADPEKNCNEGLVVNNVGTVYSSIDGFANVRKVSTYAFPGITAGSQAYAPAPFVVTDGEKYPAFAIGKDIFKAIERDASYFA
jgi:hypothetical protein